MLKNHSDLLKLQLLIYKYSVLLRIINSSQIINYTSLLTKSQRQTVKYRLPLPPRLVRQTGGPMTWSLDYILQSVYYMKSHKQLQRVWVQFPALPRLSVGPSQGVCCFMSSVGTGHTHGGCIDIHVENPHIHKK